MNVSTILSSSELHALWHQFAVDETLPDRYEITEHGELIMTPKPSNRHQLICAEVAFQLRTQLRGKAVVEAAVLTASAGVRVPDVVWMPTERWNVVITESDLLEAPDLVVEVLSPGNRKAEVAHKLEAYLASGVREVVVIGLDGSVDFHRADGVHRQPVHSIKLELPSELFA